MFCMLARKRTIRKPHQCQLSTKPIAGRTVSGIAEERFVEPGMPQIGESAGMPRSGLSSPRQSAAVTTLGRT